MSLRPILVLAIQLFGIPLFARDPPVRLGIISLTHSHAHGLLNADPKGTYEIVGIVEPSREVAARYSKQYGFSMDLVYPTTDALIAAKHPAAVAAFGNIYDHLAIVEKFAPLGVHVMVEKPLAVNLEHARKMEALAKQYNIHLLTNYETTWYPSNHRAYELLKRDSLIGPISKVVVRDGHRGPKRIGVEPEFLEWLTDPELNGGGAVIDFGCYGANLMTWLMDGRKPTAVTAVLQQQQPENNPKVDDEAIIILTYDKAVAVIEASWNWPIGRKDMEIYGQTGALYADNRRDLRIRMPKGYDGYTEERLSLDDRPAPYDDPYRFFAAVVEGEVTLKPYDLSSLENNMVVMEILDAAIRSAETGRRVVLGE